MHLFCALGNICIMLKTGFKTGHSLCCLFVFPKNSHLTHVVFRLFFLLEKRQSKKNLFSFWMGVWNWVFSRVLAWTSSGIFWSTAPLASQVCEKFHFKTSNFPSLFRIIIQVVNEWYLMLHRQFTVLWSCNLYCVPRCCYMEIVIWPWAASSCALRVSTPYETWNLSILEK